MRLDSRPRLSLSNLEAFDPRAPQRGRNRRFLCPLCGDGKPRDGAHRSLSANIETGAFFCWRCKASGKLTDFWVERQQISRRDFARQQLARLCALPPATTQSIPDDGEHQTGELQAQLQTLQPLEGTPGAFYLAGRGIPLDVANGADVRFSPNWLGRPAVVFPLCDQAGQIVAGQGRYIDGRNTPKTRSAGPKSAGLFCAPVCVEERVFDPLDDVAPALILTEAPLDALSIAVAGFPAVALCGTSGPAWLPKVCAFGRVLLAFDADPAGDEAAEVHVPLLRSLGVTCHRFRPAGVKDWNEYLTTYGCEALSEFLTVSVLMGN